VFVDTIPSTPTLVNASPVSSDASIMIGVNGHSVGNGYHFNGIIDDIRLYEKALTHDEINYSFLTKPSNITIQYNNNSSIWGSYSDNPYLIQVPENEIVYSLIINPSYTCVQDGITIYSCTSTISNISSSSYSNFSTKNI
jgi:hypothetical protein